MKGDILLFDTISIFVALAGLVICMRGRERPPRWGSNALYKNCLVPSCFLVGKWDLFWARLRCDCQKSARGTKILQQDIVFIPVPEPQGWVMSETTDRPLIGEEKALTPPPPLSPLFHSSRWLTVGSSPEVSSSGFVLATDLLD